jgi:hypothetical protein
MAEKVDLPWVGHCPPGLIQCHASTECTSSASLLAPGSDCLVLVLDRFLIQHSKTKINETSLTKQTNMTCFGFLAWLTI